MKNDEPTGAAYIEPVPYFAKKQQSQSGAGTRDTASNAHERDFSGSAAFALPSLHYALNDEEVSKLRAQVMELETELRHAEARKLSWSKRRRIEAELADVRARLSMAESPRDQQRARETGSGGDDAPPTASNSTPGAATVSAFAVHGRRAKVMRGAFGPAVMIL